MKVKTINGSFDFNLNRFRGLEGSTNYFELAGIFGYGQSYETTKLRRFVSYFATKMSYQTVSELAQERCGGVCMSDQHIQEVVLSIAEGIGQNQAEIIKNSSSVKSPMLCIADLYDADSEEVIWLESDRRSGRCKCKPTKAKAR